MASRPYTRVTPRRSRHRRNPQFRRDRRPKIAFASLEAALAIIPTLPRSMLARLTERMIDRMDEIDGDPDFEPEEDVDGAHDDGCGPVLINGHKVWGSELDGWMSKLPVYGIDQSRGPTNALAAMQERQAEEMGLERSPTGGWRHRRP